MTEQDETAARNERMEILKKASEPTFNAILDLCRVDGVIDSAKLMEHLAMHAAIHVNELGLMRQQIDALRHNLGVIQSQLHYGSKQTLGPYGRRPT